MILLTPIVIQSEAKNLEGIHVDVLVYATEILPPFGRLNDKLCQEVYCSQKERGALSSASFFLFHLEGLLTNHRTIGEDVYVVSTGR